MFENRKVYYEIIRDKVIECVKEESHLFKNEVECMDYIIPLFLESVSVGKGEHKTFWVTKLEEDILYSLGY